MKMTVEEKAKAYDDACKITYILAEAFDKKNRSEDLAFPVTAEANSGYNAALADAYSRDAEMYRHGERLLVPRTEVNNETK
jgi:hypothetical protein